MSQAIGDVLRQAAQRLEQQGIAEPRAAAEVLLADLLNCPRYTLFLKSHHPLDAAIRERYGARIERRLQGEPVQYITGSQEFWSLPFAVNPDVLIPRPETELLVEHGMRLAQDWAQGHPDQTLKLLDVGVGSGNVAISLAHSLPQSRVWGIDVALSAVRVAQANAQCLGVADRLHWICGDLTTPLQGERVQFAVCTSNLPYVTTQEWEQLPRDIKAYEPFGALCGGGDGLEVIRRLVVQSPGVLAAGGTLLLEVGWRQAGAVLALIRDRRQFATSGVWRDYADIERVVWAQMP